MKLVLSLTLLIPGLLVPGGSPKPKQPNIILFLVDDMGWQDTSVPFWTQRTPFNERYRTPNMERLAKQGIKFTQAYACTVSSPSRISLLTGMNAARHRVTNWTLQPDGSQESKHPTLDLPDWNVGGVSQDPLTLRTVYATPLPRILQDHGYFTIHCGKAHFGAIGTPGANPLNLGFNVNIAGHAAGAPQSYQGLKNFGYDENASPGNIGGVPGLSKYHGKDVNLTEALTLEAMLAMDSARTTGKPFFLYMAHYAVHAPLERDTRFAGKYEGTGLPEPEIRYASMVESMDKSLGDLMDYLEKNRLDQNTIIIFMSDNGGLSVSARGGKPNSHNRPLASGKGSAYEGGIREPMLVKWPGVTHAETITDQPVIIEDFFPTVLEMAGIKEFRAVQTIDGESFCRILTSKEERLYGRALAPSRPASGLPKSRPLIWHFPNWWGPTGPGIGASSTIRWGDYKLIYYHADQSFELFNITLDIGESRNLFADKADFALRLAQKLGEELRSKNAQMPVIRATGKPVPWPDEAIKIR
ncbi:MAG: sulfatase [Bacteroidia bacterium]|nr:sulfatase [Bacteroidia bacterium]